MHSNSLGITVGCSLAGACIAPLPSVLLSGAAAAAATDPFDPGSAAVESETNLSQLHRRTKAVSFM